MEKVKKAKKENRHGADFGLRILSIIIAVIIWFALYLNVYGDILIVECGKSFFFCLRSVK